MIPHPLLTLPAIATVFLACAASPSPEPTVAYNEPAKVAEPVPADDGDEDIDDDDVDDDDVEDKDLDDDDAQDGPDDDDDDDEEDEEVARERAVQVSNPIRLTPPTSAAP